MEKSFLLSFTQVQIQNQKFWREKIKTKFFRQNHYSKGESFPTTATKLKTKKEKKKIPLETGKTAKTFEK